MTATDATRSPTAARRRRRRPGPDEPNQLRPWVDALLERNNRRICRQDAGHPNPRPAAEFGWYPALVAAHARIRSEWDRFRSAGGDLPHIAEMLGHPDQNEGSYWKMAAFVSRGRPVPTVARAFPETTAALLEVAGLRAACWSVLGPGGWIPEHVGPNAGCLRLLLAVDAQGAEVTVGGATTTCVDGEAVVFEDTVPHATRNPASSPRAVILGDLVRPVPGFARLQNALVQRALHTFTPAYRRGPARAARRFAELNPGLLTPPD